MLSGLVLTSLAAALSHAALFQRKAKAGWLEELDDIRGQALDTPDGELANVVDADDIWTDLREGGEYDNPHEIASLYATDETPDLPSPKANAKAAAKGTRSRAKARREPEVVDAAPAAFAETGVPPAPPVAPPQVPTFEPAPMAPAAASGGEVDQLWAQPAPHPVRPSEMWHPAELAPVQLGEQTLAPAPTEERVASADLDPSRPVSSMFARPSVDDAPLARPAVPGPFEHPPFEAPADDLAVKLEAELVAAADVAITADTSTATGALDTGASDDAGLVANPVGRRNRRDRPAERKRTSLPSTVVPSGPIADGFDHPEPGAFPPLPVRGEQSPLPTAPLAPAALPSRANRLPSIDALPTTPSSVVSPETRSPFDQPPTPAALDLHEAPFDPAALVIEPPAMRTPPPIADDEREVQPAPAPEPTVEAPTPIADAAPTPVAEPSAPVAEPPAPVVEAPASPAPAAPARPSARPLPVGDDGMVDAPGTILRVSGLDAASASSIDAAVTVMVREGWCWVSPGDGEQGAMRLVLPTVSVEVRPGATVLAVVEADRSAFVIVADGSAQLIGGGADRTLARGTIAMIASAGSVQIDQASPLEIEGDPIVAHNLSLDAEL